MNYPKISIVTPSFNQAEFIEETILSVINQNYPNLEYIIIDGGSTDGSVEIIKKYEKYLAYWLSEPDNGHGDALNKGFAKATGEIMAWINSDDKYYPWTFQTVAEIFNTLNDVNWIVGHYSFWNELGRLKGTAKYRVNIYDQIIIYHHYIQQESTFWRRKLWIKTGSKINTDYKLLVDRELFARFLLIEKLWHVETVLSGFRSHENNRGKLFENQLYIECQKIALWLKKELTLNQKKNLDEINNYRMEKRAQSIIKCKIRKKIDNCFVLKLLPYFIYNKLLYFILFKYYRIYLPTDPLKLNNEELKYPVIYLENSIWKQRFEDYNFRI